MNPDKQHIDVFIAYARRDSAYLEQLKSYLKPLDRSDPNLHIWYDGEIVPGTPWEKAIKAQLEKADITLLLVSAHSLASDYFHDKEMKAALERHSREDTIVIPVILSDCVWELTELSDLQALPKDGKPIKSWADESAAYANIVRGVNRSMKEVRKRRQQIVETSKLEKQKQEKQVARQSKEKERIITAPDTYDELPEPIRKLIGDMVIITGGTFEMGCTAEQSDCYDDEKPVHTVTLSDFSIGKYQVTQEQWQAVMGTNPAYFKDCDRCPVENVSWNDVRDFIKKLNKLTGKTFRLPTEAEWEFAARGGRKSKRYKYAGSNKLDDVGWFRENSDSKTHPVGEKGSNELDLHDMSGNVWEWCDDRFGHYNSGAQTNPKGAKVGPSRVVRGGSWHDTAQSCRCTYRDSLAPSERYFILGFRLGLSLQ